MIKQLILARVQNKTCLHVFSEGCARKERRLISKIAAKQRVSPIGRFCAGDSAGELDTRLEKGGNRPCLHETAATFLIIAKHEERNPNACRIARAKRSNPPHSFRKQRFALQIDRFRPFLRYLSTKIP